MSAAPAVPLGSRAPRALAALLAAALPLAPPTAPGQTSPPPRDDSSWRSLFASGASSGPIENGARVADMNPAGHVAIAGDQFGGGPNAVRVALWNGGGWRVLGQGLRDPGGPAAAAAIALDGAGNVVVSGNFTEAVQDDGTAAPAPGIARWDVLASRWEAIGAPAGSVDALAVDAADRVVLGGTFSSVTDPHGAVVAAPHLALYDAASRTFAPVGGGTDGPVRALGVAPNGELCASGSFVQGFDAAGGAVGLRSVGIFDGTTWRALALGVVAGAIRGLSFDATGMLYAWGRPLVVTNSDGVNAAGPIVSWDGSRWSSLGYTRLPISVTVDGTGFVYALRDMHEWDVDRWAPASGWVRIGDPLVETLGCVESHWDAAVPGNVYLGGLYFGIKEPLTNTQVAVESNALWDGVHWQAMAGVGVSGTVETLAPLRSSPSVGEVVAGGNFLRAGAVEANHVARYDGDTWRTLGRGTSGPVHALDAGRDEGFVVAGGDFATVANDAGAPIVANRVALWSPAGGWEAFGQGVNGPVHAVAFLDGIPLPDPGVVVVGGRFDTATNADGSTVAVRNVALFDRDAGTWQSIGGVDGPGAVVRTIAPRGSDLEDFWVGGLFDTAVDPSGASRPASNVARWDGDAATWRSPGGGVDGEVLASQFQYRDGVGRLVLGGGFQHGTGAAGTPVALRHVGFWHEDMEEYFPLGQGTDGPVRGLTGTAGGAFRWAVGGEFGTVYDAGGAAVPAARLARFDLLSGTWDAYGSGTDDVVRALHPFRPCEGLAGEVLYAGGSFTAAGGRRADGMAKWDWTYGAAVAVAIGSPSGAGGGYSIGVVPGSCTGVQRASGSPEIVGTGAFRDGIAVDDFPRGEPFPLYLTAAGDPADVLAVVPDVVLEPDRDYAVAVVGLENPGGHAPNPDGLDTGLTAVVAELPAPSSALRAGSNTAVVLIHAVTDAPAVDVVVPGAGAVATSISYGDAAPAASLPAGAHALEVRRSPDASHLGTFPLDLSGLAGRTVAVLVSGFLDPGANGGGPALGVHGYDGAGVDVALDGDGDGIRDVLDACPQSDLAPGVDVGGCDPGVPNGMLPSGCTFNDAIAACYAEHGGSLGAVQCVVGLANSWLAAGRIGAAAQGALVACARGTLVRDAEASDRGGRVAVRSVTPVPSRHPLEVELVVPRRARVTLDVFDVAGRRLRRLLDGTVDEGRRRVAWDLRDRDGRRVAAGIYFARAASEGVAATRKIVVLE
jgi:hypothetical protein